MIDASQKISPSLENTLDIFRSEFAGDLTFKTREFHFSSNKSINCCLAYMEDSVDKKLLNEDIIKPLLNSVMIKKLNPSNILDILIKDVITSGDIKKTENIKDAIQGIIDGYALLLIDKVSECLLLNVLELKTRSIEEPPSESLIRGPREGFTESININISMIRRKIKTSELKFKFIELGTKSKTKIAVSYIESVALAPIVNEVFTRLQNINMDGIIDSNYIEELISDEPNFFMKTVGSSQRPDVISSKLLEGRIAILCDGTPEILTVPYLFIENLQSPEDYYNNYIYMSFNRILRWASFFLTTSVPAIYVALVNFHQELIPTQLIVSLAAARQNVPLPTVVEAFSMMLFYEILREAGARSPKQIGEALSIVGALVLGDAAVNAKFISAPIVIITGVTGITGLAVPKVLSLVIVRIIFLALAACLGLYGYIFGVIALTLYLMSIRSFGVTYMERVGIGPINVQYLKDTAIRMPIAKMKTRPNSISNNIFRNRTQKNKKE